MGMGMGMERGRDGEEVRKRKIDTIVFVFEADTLLP